MDSLRANHHFIDNLGGKHCACPTPRTQGFRDHGNCHDLFRVGHAIRKYRVRFGAHPEKRDSRGACILVVYRQPGHIFFAYRRYGGSIEDDRHLLPRTPSWESHRGNGIELSCDPLLLGRQIRHATKYGFQGACGCRYSGSFFQHHRCDWIRVERGRRLEPCYRTTAGFAMQHIHFGSRVTMEAAHTLRTFGHEGSFLIRRRDVL